TLLAARGGIDGLTVHAGRGPWRVGLLRRPDLGAEPVVDDVEGAVVAPVVEVTPDGAFGRQVLGQVTPLAACAQDVEDGIDYVAQVGLARVTVRVDRQVRFDQGPLGVGYVAGVRLCSHTSFYASPPLMGQSLNSLMKGMTRLAPNGFSGWDYQA